MSLRLRRIMWHIRRSVLSSLSEVATISWCPFHYSSLLQKLNYVPAEPSPPVIEDSDQQYVRGPGQPVAEILPPPQTNDADTVHIYYISSSVGSLPPKYSSFYLGVSPSTPSMPIVPSHLNVAESTIASSVMCSVTSSASTESPALVLPFFIPTRRFYKPLQVQSTHGTGRYASSIFFTTSGRVYS